MVTVTGTITRFSVAPLGEMNGFKLDNGTTVHFPPHTGSKLVALLKKGEKVSVSGMVRAGVKGQPEIEASQIRNLGSGKSVNVAAIAPPEVMGPEGSAPPPVG